MINCIKIETSSAFRHSQPFFSPHHYNRLHRTLAKNWNDTISKRFCPHEIQRFTCGQEHKKLAAHDNAGLLALSGLRNPYPSRLGVIAKGALADLFVVDLSKGARNMCKIIYRTHVSLDGLIEMPGGRPDWVIADEELFRYSNNLERQVGSYLWGRGMYENNQALWATAGAQSMEPFVVEFLQIVKQIPAIVFSSTLERVAGNARLERGDPVAVVTRLKEQPGPDLSVGGVQLASALMQAGLVDEYQFFVQPIILGAGRPLYPRLNEAVRLKLVETHTFHTGIVYLRYQR